MGTRRDVIANVGSNGPPQLPYLLLEVMLLFRKAAQEVWQEACVGAHVLVQKAVHTCNWFCSGSTFRRNRSSSPDNAHS